MKSTPLRPLLGAVLFAAAQAGTVHAAVQVIVGPTPMPDGEATAARDITVMNEKLAFVVPGLRSGAFVAKLSQFPDCTMTLVGVVVITRSQRL